jgi:dienelactone hydrolase
MGPACRRDKENLSWRMGLPIEYATRRNRSQIFLGGNHHVASIPVQQKLMAAFQANGQPPGWHFFHRVGHGFAMADGDCYDPGLAEQAWGLMVNFMGRKLANG